MSSKVAHYLQEHLVGEVTTALDARRAFACDASIFTITPALIVYPRNENDVRKAARFTWQLAERGRVIPITARGAGSDFTGAALGSGIVMAFQAHMNRIVEFDTKSGVVVVEPGINYGKLQQALHTHDRFLPPFPTSLEYSTVGGAVANNAGGEKSVKYGSTRDYVRGLNVVLANGELIQTGRLNRRDLNKKLGLSTFEGEIYRAVDSLLEENQDKLTKANVAVTKNSAGYALGDVKKRDGSFDLTPLFVGSQGTLGIVTQAMLETEPYNNKPVLLVGFFDSFDKVQQVITDLRQLPDQPSAVELVDEQLLATVDKLNPNQLKDVVSKPLPKIVLLVEFDTVGERQQKKLAKKAQKLLEKYGANCRIETEPAEQERYWKIRHSSALWLSRSESGARALPIIEDGIVPVDRLHEYLTALQALFTRHRLPLAIWGHAADVNLHIQPLLDLNQVGDRQMVFRLMEDYYSLVLSLGGSISAQHGDGRLRGPYVKKMFGDEIYGLFQKIKQIFDPYGILNPGVKIDVTLDDLKPILRTSYSLDQFYGHMPRS